MPEPLELSLTPAQRLTLEQMRDRHPRPHHREKAAALLQIAGGRSGEWVARHGLLRPRKPETVYRWVRRYREGGIAGFRVLPGRGRRPAFSPSLRE